MKDCLALSCLFKIDGHEIMMVQSALMCISPAAQIQRERKHIAVALELGLNQMGKDKSPMGPRTLRFWQYYSP